MGKNKEIVILERVQSLNDAVGHSKDLSDLFAIISETKLGKTCFSSSLGQEDQVLTDYIFRNQLSIDVFTLDTTFYPQHKKNTTNPFKAFFQMIKRLKNWFLIRESMAFMNRFNIEKPVVLFGKSILYGGHYNPTLFGLRACAVNSRPTDLILQYLPTTPNLI
jgi:hypothetical protein